MYCFSSFEEFITLRDAINEKLTKIAGDGALRLFIAINEGVNNAIFHGNKEETGKKVYLTIEKIAEEIKVVIRDEGHGFKKNANDYTADLWGEHGRGMELIAHCVDSYSRNELGNEMTLVKRINL